MSIILEIFDVDSLDILKYALVIIHFTHVQVITVKHLLFAWPYFREATTLQIFTRLNFRDVSYLVL